MSEQVTSETNQTGYTFDRHDAVMLAGLALVVSGVAMLSIPASLITAGVGLIVLSYLSA
jgi:hypothetical protein